MKSFRQAKVAIMISALIVGGCHSTPDGNAATSGHDGSKSEVMSASDSESAISQQRPRIAKCMGSASLLGRLLTGLGNRSNEIQNQHIPGVNDDSTSTDINLASSVFGPYIQSAESRTEDDCWQFRFETRGDYLQKLSPDSANFSHFKVCVEAANLIHRMIAADPHDLLDWPNDVKPHYDECSAWSGLTLPPKAAPKPTPTGDQTASPVPIFPEDWIQNAYPPDLEKAGIGGTVKYELNVSMGGNVDDCKILQSSGQPELDDHTCSSLRETAKFTPAKDETGSPVRGVYDGIYVWKP